MRVDNPQLLKSYRGKNCMVCFQTEGTVAHHIKTKGSGGDDSECNLIPLCQLHHREVHDKGMTMFAGKYSSVRIYLESKGWEFDEYMYRWFRQETLF